MSVYLFNGMGFTLGFDRLNAIRFCFIHSFGSRGANSHKSPKNLKSQCTALPLCCLVLDESRKDVSCIHGLFSHCSDRQFTEWLKHTIMFAHKRQHASAGTEEQEAALTRPQISPPSTTLAATAVLLFSSSVDIPQTTHLCSWRDATRTITLTTSNTFFTHQPPLQSIHPPLPSSSPHHLTNHPKTTP